MVFLISRKTNQVFKLKCVLKFKLNINKFKMENNNFCNKIFSAKLREMRKGERMALARALWSGMEKERERKRERHRRGQRLSKCFSK